MDINTVMPEFRIAWLAVMGKVFANIDEERSNDYLLAAHDEAVILGMQSVDNVDDCPALLKQYELETAYNQGYAFSMESKAATAACAGCSRRNTECFAGCRWV